MIVEEKFNESIKDLLPLLLREGKTVYLNARGMSMYPFIKNGDRIKIVPVNEKEIKIGDIIAVRIKDRTGPCLRVHRVVKIADYKGRKIYFTKGDFHRRGLDGYVTKELIAGKLTQIKRNNLTIDLGLPLWKYLNKIIAKLSFRYPEVLHFLSRYINLVIEWRLFFLKLKNRFKKGNPVLYNTEELLLVCTHKDLNERLKKKARELIKEGVDWEHFTMLAIRGGAPILVYNALKEIAPSIHILQFMFDRLKASCLLILAKTTSQHRQLLELLRLFAQKDIPVLPLKGTLLSKRLYGDIAMRGLNVDFDLLIKENDKEQAKVLLGQYGYHPGPNTEIKQWQWQNVFTKPKETMIDLHWDITMMVRSKERIEGLWKGARLVEADIINYYEFKEEDLLLYLSAHLVSSGCCTQLRYICDINELLHRYKDTLNWDEVIEKAGRWRLSNSLYISLKLSKLIFGSDLLFGLLHKLKPHFFTLILINVFIDKKVILRKAFRRHLINSFLSYIFFELVEARSAKDYFSIFKRVFFPPKEAIGNRSHILRIINGIKKHLLQ